MRPAPLLLAAALVAACAGAPPLDMPPPPPPHTEAQRDLARPTPLPSTDLQVAGPIDDGPPDPQRTAQIADGPAPCAQDKRILACRRAPIDSSPPIFFDLAVTSTEIAIAWAAGDVDKNKAHLIHFASFRQDLSFLGQVAHPTGGAPTGVAIAAMPQGGWMIAVTTSQSVVMHPLHADGRASAGRVMIQGGAQNMGAPHLVGRPNGGPLLVWSSWGNSGQTTSASLLDEAAHERFRVPLFTNVVEPNLTNAVFAGDAFLVAGRVGSTGTIARVELNGRVAPLVTPVGAPNEYHQLAFTGSSARMTYCDFGKDPLIRWASLDRGGKLISGPLTIGRTPEHYDPSPLVTIGEDSIVLLGGYTGITGTASHLEILRLDSAGRTLVKPWPVLASRQQRLTEYRIASLNTRVALAWLEGAMQPGSPAKSVNMAVIAP